MYASLLIELGINYEEITIGVVLLLYNNILLIHVLDVKKL